MQQIIGRARTLELLLTNARLSAAQAHDWGLVHEVAPPAEAVNQAVGFALRLHPGPGYVVRETRALLDTLNIRNQLQLEAVAIRTAARGRWFREALDAFITEHRD
jgi:2-(1,2-epoxy-1,2-dihydrophenyl)acetyl-CoA isomerase